MSSPVDPTAGVASSTSGVSATSGASTTTAPSASATAAAASIPATLSSLGQLQQESPAVYKAMMQGIAMNICDAMQQQEADLENEQKEYERDG